MAAWRQEQRLDQLMLEQFEELPLVRQHYPQFFHKTDRWGRPVWIELLGHIDVDALLKVRWLQAWPGQLQRTSGVAVPERPLPAAYRFTDTG